MGEKAEALNWVLERALLGGIIVILIPVIPLILLGWGVEKIYDEIVKGRTV